MAGIYIHIPFCKKACHYCDFHFSTSLKYMEEMVTAICIELALKKERLQEPVHSIYFGGGTPSLLSEAAFQKIFEAIYSHYNVQKDAEITIEANPDDLTPGKLKMFRSMPVNRFSIGVQSFFEEDLKWMNRAHNSSEAERSVKSAQDLGFENLTIDLIYGYPLLSDEKWDVNLQTATGMDIPHISAYSMTVEGKTALANAVEKGLQPNMDDVQSARQFLKILSHLEGERYEQYEISNFARGKLYAIHNTNYWRGLPYLGIGPSAHGFNGQTRYFNVANNALYMDKVLMGALAEASELLSQADKFNECVMTGLRTIWGINLKTIEQAFGASVKAQLLQDAETSLERRELILTGDVLTLSREGKLYADKIAADLFQVD